VMRTSEEHSLGFHQRASTCVDDIKVESSRLKATKDFEKKEVIAYLPLHSTPCTTNPCVGRHPCRSSVADGSTICPLLGVWPQSSDRPNIKVELMDEEQKQAGENKTAWKFTASRAIQAGDEVRTVLLDILARNLISFAAVCKCGLACSLHNGAGLSFRHSGRIPTGHSRSMIKSLKSSSSQLQQ